MKELTLEQAEELAEDRASEVLNTDGVTEDSGFYLDVYKEELRRIKQDNEIVEGSK